MPRAYLSFPGEDGQQTVLLDRDQITVGRLKGQDIQLQDRCVSRQHGLILKTADGYCVIDQGSSHGTFLNGVRIQRGSLNPGDSLQFGSLQAPVLKFHIESTPEGQPASEVFTGSQLLSSIHDFPKADDRQPRAAREMEQLSWLLSAARQLNAGGAIEDILSTLLRLTLQLTGVERGFVFLSEAGHMKLARGLNAKGELVQQDSTISHRAIEKAIRSDAKFSISDTLADDSAARWASVVVNNIRSIYCIPLRRRDARGQNAELLGLLYLDSQLGAGRLNEVDHQLLDTVSTEAAALLHNALLSEAEYKSRRAREELARAAEIHSGLMPESLPAVPYASLLARSVPCHEIGGDFFDAIALDDCVCLVIADVSGKGLPAAIVAATIQGIIHAQLLSRQSFPAIAAQLNHFLCTRKVGKYATLVLVRLFPDGRLEYMNCGHVQPLVVRPDGVTHLEDGNLIVGLLPAATYTSSQSQLNPGDRLLLLTDGLAEAENAAGDPFGDSRMSEAAQQHDIYGILELVSRFHAPSESQDDCTLMELRYIGTPVDAEKPTGVIASIAT